jgi:hypothetical protein|tara:strand:- start:495 stop:1013 length:519 start_codon:yes stop_codon:yes gene_type:complete
LAKLNRQQLNAIKEKVRQQKAEAAQQKQIEELKLKESGNTQDQEDTTPKTLKDVKALLEKQKQEAAQSGQPHQTQKQKLKKIKKEVKGKIPKTRRRQMKWSCGIGDLVILPGRLYGASEDLYGIIVKESIDNRGIPDYTGSRVVTDNTQYQILTTGGFRWIYAKGLKKIEVD